MNCLHRILFSAFSLLSVASVQAQDWQKLVDRVDSLRGSGQIQSAYDLSIKCQQQAEREFGKTHANYGISASLTGQILQELGNYDQAEQWMKQGAQIIEQSSTPDGEDYSFAITVLGQLYSVRNRMPEALANFDKALAIRERLYGKNSDKYVEILTALAVAHATVGRYELAISEIKEGLSTRKKLYGTNHPIYGESVSVLGSLYVDVDDYIQAEPLLIEALRIREIVFGKDNIYYWYTLNNLAALKSRMGDYEKSILLERELLDRMTKANQQNGLFLSTLMLLAGDYFHISKYDSADSLYLTGLNITERLVGKNHIRYSNNLFGRGALHEKKGQFDKAEALYLDALERCKASVGVRNEPYLNMTWQLARLYTKMGQYSRADSICTKLRVASKQIMGATSINYGSVLQTQLSNYRLQNDEANSLSTLSEVNKLNEDILTHQLPYWTSHQREKYMAKYSPDYQESSSAAANLYHKPEARQAMYQQTLFYKNLLLSQHIDLLINGVQLADNKLRSLTDTLRLVSNQIAAQYVLPLIQRKNLDSLETRAETLEKKLARQAVTFRQARQSLQVRWQDVRDALKPTDAAVEFVSFRYHNGREQTDSVRYLALVLRPGDLAPKVVPLLANEAVLSRLLARKTGQSGGTALYTARGSELDTDQLTRGDSLYQLGWQPIDSLLTRAKTVYISPSGLLHQVAFAVLPYRHPNTKKTGYLADYYQLRQVGSTRQIATPSTNDDTYQSIVSAKLYGGIRYDSTETEQPGIWPFLPGTLREVDQISQFIGKKATVVTGASASEADIKSLSGKSPSVLHIATHGFAFPDPLIGNADGSPGGNTFQRITNPLFRSGLLMAGSRAAWQRERPVLGQEDGILTAYEVANLNLANTKLVVLSACETALGDIRGSEGVFGLQRAFKMAGAGYLLLSLWPVPDEPTSSLMTQFYRNWKRYKTIRLAFEQTQLQMRKKYPPSVWAAFVLVE